ncbi:STAS/SEC14 domain-containing protein [Halobacillus halophilus]|uniref:STAS/SEC14 domain-containing protein n=1 Tax=Halobacillus halophilus TaxID=1570 RepID=UPI001CD6E829|nr:STAS/SEC14 domain-containing protein [Halobacillus halophilus]MCA1011920.1 STAS/SEC14 domain-containing protein [Halobacillus halophilus]
MFTILSSRDPSTIVIDVREILTGQDAKMLDNYIEGYFDDDQNFNILAFIPEVQGSTLEGFWEGTKLNLKRWKQFSKFAVITERAWIEVATQAAGYLPGLKAKDYKPNQLEDAWSWLKED